MTGPMSRKTRLILLLSACLSTPAWSAAGGVMLRDDSLRAGASTTAASLGTASKGSKVEILIRQGGWTQIRAGAKTGWVRILSVRGETSGASGSLGDVAALAEKRDPDKVVATAGLRGLSEEELRQARYDPEQLRQLDSLAVTPEEARRFAADGHLTHVPVDYLPAPAVEAKAKETRHPTLEGFDF